MVRDDTMKVLDVCTKYGTETQAFKDRGHEVTLLGIEGDVDIKQDVRTYHTSEYYDFVWMSPPCTEFSIADWRKGACKERNPDLSVVFACLRLISEIKPRYWVMENPKGCLRYFIGRPFITVDYSDYGYFCRKPTDLWGYYPKTILEYKTPSLTIELFVEKTFGFDKSKTERRSDVPYNLGLAFCLAIEKELVEPFTRESPISR